MPPYDPERHHRRSVRLNGYDYTQPGAYFITLCTHEHVHLFGRMVDGTMVLNALGEIVREEWFRSSDIRTEIELYADEFIVMPNHIHGIVWLMDNIGTASQNVGAHGRAPFRRPPKSLGSFIAGFKSATTQRINRNRRTPGAPVWQRNYYEHIIRDCTRTDHRAPLHAIRRYIHDNPMRWHLDRYNLNATGSDPLAHEIWRMMDEQEAEP